METDGKPRFGIDRGKFSLPASNGADRFLRIGEVSALNTFVMPLLHGSENDVSEVGSAFIVDRRGYALTAKHNITDFIGGDENRLGEFWLPYFNPLLGSTDSKEVFGEILYVEKVQYTDRSDLALLELAPKYNLEIWPFLFLQRKLKLGFPSIGEECFAIGFDEIAYTEENGSLHCGMRISYGKIKEIYYPFRDLVLLNGPSFRTDAKYDPGMSGGPIISASSGCVIGIVSTGLGPLDDGDDIAFGSLLFPIMHAPVRCPRESESGLLWDGVKEGTIAVDSCGFYTRVGSSGIESFLWIAQPEVLTVPMGIEYDNCPGWAHMRYHISY